MMLRADTTPYSRIAGLVALAAIALCCAPDIGKERKANEFEFAYSYLASRLNMPVLCEKIAPHAYLSAGFGGKGYQTTYTRSECYNKLALETGDAGYCANVKERDHALSDGSAMTERSCRKRIADGRRLNSSGGDLELLMRFMGYRESDLDIKRSSGTRTRTWDQLLSDLARTPEIRDRAGKLPDFSLDGPPLGPGFTRDDIGCEGRQDRPWYCYVFTCLESDDESFREACLEVSRFLQTLQRADPNQTRRPTPSPYVLRLLEKYPQLRTPEIP